MILYSVMEHATVLSTKNVWILHCLLKTFRRGMKVGFADIVRDIFKEEALLPDGGASNILHKEEWPSDESEDVDYDPEIGKSSSSDGVAASESDASEHANSSSSFRSLEDDIFFLLGRPERLETDGTNDQEVLCQPRPRATVDYIKLNDELFGKNASLTEQISEDEEWGPTRRKRRRKEPDCVSTTVISDDMQDSGVEENVTELKRIRNDKRRIFRFPLNVVEKLRSVFVAENELPSRAIRENLSVQMGIEVEKVNKWFKNSRYLALKARKKARSTDSPSPITEEDISTASRMDNNADEVSSRDVTLSCEEESPETSKWKKQNDASLAQDYIDFGDDVSLKYLREKFRKKKLESKRQKDMLKAETDMKRLCQIKGKVEKLQEAVQRLISRKSSKPSGPPKLNESCVVYVPVAELQEKR